MPTICALIAVTAFITFELGRALPQQRRPRKYIVALVALLVACTYAVIVRI